MISENNEPLVATWPVDGAAADNWGDKFNPILINLLSEKPVVHVSEPAFRDDLTVYRVIGSSLANAERREIVWGSGFIRSSDRISNAGRICAVRGPLTRRRLAMGNIACPAVYGDPALLSPLFHQPTSTATWDIGVIQHFRDVGQEPLPILPKGVKVKVIDILGGITEVIDDVVSCSHIISSSLHGLIIAHAYGVPGSWIKFSDRPLGNDFKFRDYWASMGWNNAQPIRILGGASDTDLFLPFSHTTPVVDVRSLLESCPFIAADRRRDLLNRSARMYPRIPEVAFIRPVGRRASCVQLGYDQDRHAAQISADEYDSAVNSFIFEEPSRSVQAIGDGLLTTLAESGRLEAARGLIDGLSRNVGSLSALTPVVAKILVRFCLRFSVGRELGQALATNFQMMATAESETILEFIDLLAATLDERTFSQALLNIGAASASSNDGADATDVILQGAIRYANILTLSDLLAIIDDGRHSELLNKIPTARRVANRAEEFSAQSIMLPRSGLNYSKLISHSPPKELMARAIRNRDAVAFSKAARRAIQSSKSPDAIVKSLRDHSSELRDFCSADQCSGLYEKLDGSTSLLLACVLSDREALDKWRTIGMFNNIHPAIAAIESACGNNVKVSEIASAGLGERGLAPWRFDGETIEAIFASAGAVEVSPSKRSHGLVSVVMAAHNPNISHVNLAVQSVLNQSYEDIELLIVDDASDEVCGSQIRELAASSDRVIYMRRGERAGPYVCRNMALEAGSGAFFAIHDASDVAHPQRLEFQIGQLVSEGRVATSTAACRFDLTGHIQFDADLNVFGDCATTACFRADLFDKVGVFLPVRSSGDAEFRHRVGLMLGRNSFGKVDVPLMLCHSEPGALSHETDSLNSAALKLFRSIYSDFEYDPRYNAGRYPFMDIPYSVRAECTQ